MIQLQESRKASRELARLSNDIINNTLLLLADEVVARTATIVEANQKDLAQMERSNPMYDRLLLTPERIASIAADMRQVAALPSPLGKVLAQDTRPNGMRLSKVVVPFGVIGVIYEARPNVTLDVFSLCFKTKNACVLKGGTDAYHSNAALTSIIHDVLKRQGINPQVVALMPPHREATMELLQARGLVDLIIPRGSAGLINYVRENSKVPVIETGTGVCHVYIDEFADIEKAASIITNAKTRRPSVCNTAECLVVHQAQLPNLPKICAEMALKGVTLYADARTKESLQSHYPAPLLQEVDPQAHYGHEFLDLKLALKTTNSMHEAIDHINTYSSMHSESIVSENQERIKDFQLNVDSACVYANVSTAFTDGAQFGLGAEIGVSNQKLHARGPMGLAEICSYKWLIEGEGQVRP